MPLGDLTKESVQQAIAEFDQLGRENFLNKYGYGQARDYILIHNGHPYDSKAIAGVAHKFLGGVALMPHEFSGGKEGAAGRLEKLDFLVRGPNEQLSPIPSFEPGAIYNRVRDIHDLYGGQRQGGISTPRQAPLIFIFTGESGDQYGYRDGPREDGSFAYTGEGQLGDMEFVRGNLGIRDHVTDGRDLFLFEKQHSPGNYRFIGNFAFDGFEYATAPDRAGASRQVIVFNLRPVVSGEERELDKAASELHDQTLDELRRRAIADANHTPIKSEGRRAYVQRSASVKAYVIKRANGICESCDQPAPFVRSNGEPYLEPHHIRRLADGGPDHPLWVGAICPACHREIHHGKDGRTRNDNLRERIAGLEPR